MPNDTLDEIEARWKQPLPFIRDVSPITVWRRAKADVDATIEMVRARDRVVKEAAKETAIAWSVCASIHREFGKGRDAVYKTRQSDFVKHEADARAALAAIDTPPVQEQKR